MIAELFIEPLPQTDINIRKIDIIVTMGKLVKEKILLNILMSIILKFSKILLIKRNTTSVLLP